MKKVTKYKGWTIVSSGAQFGFFASGRGGKVVRSYWVSHDSNPEMGKWCKSISSAKKFIDESEAKVQSEIKKNGL